MDLNDHYHKLLGLTGDWRVTEVTLSLADHQMEIAVGLVGRGQGALPGMRATVSGL